MKFDIAGLFKKKKSSDDDYDDDYDYEDDDEEEGGAEESGGGDDDGGADDDYDDDSDYDDEDEDGGGLSDKQKKLAIIGGGAAAAVALIGGGLWWFLGGNEEEMAEQNSPQVTGGSQVSLALPTKGARSGGGQSGTMTPPKRKGPSLNEIGQDGGQAASAAPSLNSLNSLNDAASSTSAPAPTGAAPGTMAPAAMVAPGSAPKVAALSGNSAVKTGKMPTPSGGAGVVVPSVFESSYTNVAKANPGKPLIQAPVKELVEQTNDGLLPVKSAQGQTVQQVYARPFNKNDQRKRIAVVVGGLGLSSAATQAAITHLPPEVTLAFDAYGRQLEKWIPAARAAGHEVLISLPMEPINYPISDPGPLALLTTLKTKTNIDRLHKIMGKGAGYVGLITTQGSQFTTSENSLRPVLIKLQERGVLLVDLQSTPSSKIEKIGGEVGLTVAKVDVPLDTQATPESIDLALGQLEDIARAGKWSMGLASPYPVSIDRIVSWAASLKDKNMVLAPVSAVAVASKAPVATAAPTGQSAAQSLNQ